MVLKKCDLKGKRKRNTFEINFLSRGMESEAKMNLLISATRINSETLTRAIIDHYCHGFSIIKAGSLNGVASSNVSAAIVTLNSIAAKFEEYMVLKKYELTSTKLSKEEQSVASSNLKYNKEWEE